MNKTLFSMLFFGGCVALAIAVVAVVTKFKKMSGEIEGLKLNNYNLSVALDKLKKEAKELNESIQGINVTELSGEEN